MTNLSMALKNSAVASSFGPWHRGWAVSWHGNASEDRQFPAPCPGQDSPCGRSARHMKDISAEKYKIYGIEQQRASFTS